MRPFYFMLLICTLLLFTQCDNAGADPETSASSVPAPEKAALSDSLHPVLFTGTEKEPAPHITLNGKKKERTETSAELEKAIDDEIARQLALNPDLPALNAVAEAYNNSTVDLFTGLAAATNGKTFMVDDATYVVQAITEIIQGFMTEKTDLVFLVDKTGSMSDDIGEIRKSIDNILDAVKPFKNTRVGFAFYGDKNADGGIWFTLNRLSDDFTTGKNIIRDISTTGGGDMPESVTDGIARTIKEMNWEPGNRRMILLIGDAPSLEPPFADHTIDDVIRMAQEEEVKMNFYPVVIGMNGKIKGVVQPEPIKTEKKDIIASIAPNPATNYTLLKATASANYTAEVFNISGELVSTKSFTDNNCSILTDALPTGVYVVRLFNTDDKTVDTKKFVVRR